MDTPLTKVPKNLMRKALAGWANFHLSQRFVNIPSLQALKAAPVLVHLVEILSGSVVGGQKLKNVQKFLKSAGLTKFSDWDRMIQELILQK